MLTTLKAIESSGSLQEKSEESGTSLSSLLWKSLEKNTCFCYFWKDRERRFVGATKAFLDYYGFSFTKDILGKTDEDMNWHIDNNTYRLDEIDVLNKGKVVENVVGECIIQGKLHHITCYKWPIYQEGEIIGLMGIFFDANALYSKVLDELPFPYGDPITGLHNRQGFLGDLIRYQEAYTMERENYALIILESRFDEHIQESYDDKFLRELICREADILRQSVGKDSAIARIHNATFGILRRESNPQAVYDTVELPTVIIQKSPFHHGNFPIKSGTP